MLRNPNGNVWLHLIALNVHLTQHLVSSCELAAESSVKAGWVYSDAFSECSPSPELVVQGLSAPKLNSSWLIFFPRRVTFEHMYIFSNITSCSKLHYVVGEMSIFVLNLLLAISTSRPPSSCTGRNDKQWFLTSSPYKMLCFWRLSCNRSQECTVF